MRRPNQREATQARAPEDLGSPEREAEIDGGGDQFSGTLKTENSVVRGFTFCLAYAFLMDAENKVSAMAGTENWPNPSEIKSEC
jgi:hypothetical protein